MIAVDEIYRDALFCQSGDLFDEEQPCLIIAPVSVVEIAGDDDEGDFLIDRCVDQIGEGGSGGRPDWRGGGRALLARQPLERTVEVNIAGMDKSKAAHMRIAPIKD